MQTRAISQHLTFPPSQRPITNLIGPAQLGQVLKPFIFLDYFSADVEPGFGFGMHPHSGIATLTYQPDCDVQYEDTTGQNGVLKAGGLEWMNAGGGAWHKASLMTAGKAKGFQLWVSMPQGVEDGPAVGQYIAPEDVPVHQDSDHLVKVLLGNYKGLSSPIVSHQDMDYYAIEMQANSRWTHTASANHQVAWLYVYEGNAVVNGVDSQQQLMIFDGADTAGLIEVQTRAGAKLIFGSAVSHNHPLVLGRSSVHTSEQSLRDAERRIQQIGRELYAAGKL